MKSAKSFLLNRFHVQTVGSLCSRLVVPIYHGSNSGVAPFDLSASEALTVDIKATDEGFRGTLKNLAIAAIASDNIIDVDAH